MNSRNGWCDHVSRRMRGGIFRDYDGMSVKYSHRYGIRKFWKNCALFFVNLDNYIRNMSNKREFMTFTKNYAQFYRFRTSIRSFLKRFTD